MTSSEMKSTWFFFGKATNRNTFYDPVVKFDAKTKLSVSVPTGTPFFLTGEYEHSFYTGKKNWSVGAEAGPEAKTKIEASAVQQTTIQNTDELIDLNGNN